MKHPRLKDLNKFFSEFFETDNNNQMHTKSDGYSTVVEACSSKDTAAGESSTTIVKSDTHISVLPVEMLLKIFSYLTDYTLIEVTRVSEQWKQILDTQQDMWRKYTTKRWPLLQRKTETTSWLKVRHCLTNGCVLTSVSEIQFVSQMYTALESSCFCRTCAEMMQNGQNTSSFKFGYPIGYRRLRNDKAVSEINGIRTVSLDENMTRWHASITGPVDSPYEGGTFFLYIQIANGCVHTNAIDERTTSKFSFHCSYPFKPPIIKFLTKIIHPNISRHGDIGLAVLTGRYSSSLTITHLLLSIQNLLCDPFTEATNVEVCIQKVYMEPQLGRLYEQHRPRYDALVRHWTKKYAMMDEISFVN